MGKKKFHTETINKTTGRKLCWKCLQQPQNSRMGMREREIYIYTDRGERER